MPLTYIISGFESHGRDKKLQKLYKKVRDWDSLGGYSMAFLEKLLRSSLQQPIRRHATLTSSSKEAPLCLTILEQKRSSKKTLIKWLQCSQKCKFLGRIYYLASREDRDS